MSPITSVLINADASEPELRRIAQIGGVGAFAVGGLNTDLLVACADGAQLAIAYMSASTLLHAIRQGDLCSRVAKLREHSAWCYLIIRDALAPDTHGRTVHNGRPTGWSWVSVQGALLSVQELGVGVLSIRDESDLDACVLTLAQRDRSARRLSPPRETLWATPGERLLTSLPGVGPETADQLLTECSGNVALALHALTNGAVPGITEAKQGRIRDALGLNPDEYLAIYTESNDDDDDRLSDRRTPLAGAGSFA